MATASPSSSFSFSSIIRAKPFDERTGLVSREWVLFFQELFNRTGGTDGIDSAVIEELVVTLYNSVRPVNISPLESLLRDISVQLQAAQRGTPGEIRTAIEELSLRLLSIEKKISSFNRVGVDELSARLLAVERKITDFNQSRAPFEELRSIVLAS